MNSQLEVKVLKKTLFFSAFGLFLLFTNTETYADSIKVKINGETRGYDQAPIMRDNRVFIPIRGISEDTGANVKYSGNLDKKVTIQLKGTTIEFVIGTNKALVNGVATDLPESFILNNRTMLPLRFINEMLGYRVDWSGTEQSVSITTDRGFIANSVINNSQKYLGTPYLFGGTYEKDKKFDCSSFVQKVFGESGIQLPRTSIQQSQLGSLVNMNNLKTGDLIFFDIEHVGKVSHVAIYIDANTLLHATTSKGVNYTTFSQYWKDRIVMAKDILELN
ncbi:hypothetical protein CON36_30645 [Bacillus cereus]|uniref:NlpC/P60 domain-containing protein n=1 Tax=Bacillus cereus TaxID=1396 RepID=A0A9X6SUI5_BACCE|nr:hypothetical protein CON36_30645 [Bacillus cereus]